MAEWTEESFRRATDFWRPRLLLAALELDLFTPLARAPSTADELAGDLDLDAAVVGALLDSLVALELLDKDDGVYRLLPFAAAHLVRGAPGYAGDLPRALARDWVLWGELPALAGRGRSADREDVFLENRLASEELSRGLRRDAMALAPALLDRLDEAGVDLSDRRRLLDVAGGHGAYTAAFCVRHPGLRATLVDLPGPLAVARETLAGAGLDRRVRLVEADLREAALPTGNDLALVSFALHAQGPEAAAALLHRLRRALEPGSVLIVQEVLLDADRAGPEWGALFNLNLLVHTGRGRCLTRGELLALLEDAGFVEARVLVPERLVVARTP